MTILSRSVSMKTYGLALAIVLSPAMMQTGTCYPAGGDATLSSLEVEVMDENHISAFDPDQRNYNVWLPLSADTAIVHAYSTDPGSQVSYNLSKINVYQGTLETIDYGYFPTGGGEVTLDGLLPEGRSALGIRVRAPGGKRVLYTVAIQVGGGREYIVSPSGDDGNPGTQEAPFRTINRAAQIAQPGDTITVQSGVYREWVRPARGGSSEETRITYRAAPGADVRILGSEPATGWVQTSDKVWGIELDESRFDGFNPFNTLTRHPECVPTNEPGDCWGWLNYGRWTHLGDVYIDGAGLTEKQTMGEIAGSPLSWRTETVNGTTTIWANFGERDPNEATVELNHRPFAFFPEQAGLGYITVKGFVIQNVATHWAPPGVFQPGAIGPNGGHHWVIEDNIVMYSKAVCISIGIPSGSADLGASGYHVIRNNVIMRCGQSGITGMLYIKNSQIVGNHIEEINYRNEFGGAETAAIKHHFGAGLHIAGNFIRGVTAGHGIWADVFNNNWRVEGNVVLGAGVYAVMAEANHGPNLYANNVFAGGGIGVYSSRADAWVHNLFVNTPQTWVNQDWGGRLPVADARWVNSMFIGDGLNASLAPPDNRYNRNVFLDGAVPHPDDADAVIGNTPTDVQVLETSQAVALGFQVDEATLNAGYPLVDNETLELNFTIDATVDTDFFGEQRSEISNSPGPFATLQPGRNEFTVYEYPPLYLKAQCFTGCDDSNECTVDACNPAAGCEHTAVPDGTPCGDGFGTCQDGTCSGTFPCTEQGIRDAITAGGGPHTFDCGTTVVTQAEIVIDNDVILDGEGQLTVHGDQSHRVFSVTTGTTAELIGFTVAGGATSEHGGGIVNYGKLTLTNTSISGNSAFELGGGIGNFATLTLTNSTVSGNTANSGGGILNVGALTLVQSTVSGNSADVNGGALWNHWNGVATLFSSTVSQNTAGLWGGAADNFGSLTITNSSVSQNLSREGGGAIFNEGDGTVTILNSTVSDNAATVGAGDGICHASSQTVTLTNTLVDNDCFGSNYVSGGHNIESPGNTCGLGHPTDQVNVPDPMLGPLADNGGPTETHALLPGSPAIDRIPEAACEVETDQRGLPRPVAILGAEPKCDVGAFEVQSGGTGGAGGTGGTGGAGGTGGG